MSKMVLSGAVLVLGLSLAGAAVAADGSFGALQGISAAPMTAAEMDAVQGKNWWTTGYTWHTIASPALNETVTTSNGSTVTVVIGSGGGSATVSGSGFTYTYTTPN